MNLQEYIQQKYGNKSNWFIDEWASVSNQQNIKKVIDNKKYLEGEHEILKSVPFVHNGKVIEPRKIVINLANQLISWQTAFLLKNNIQMVGNERVADHLNEINKRAKYNLINNDILKMLLSYGLCGEYVFMDQGRIKSKVLDPSTFVPIYNRHRELIAVVEYHKFEDVTYYTVYDSEKVQEWSDRSGKVTLDAQYASLTGLPIIWGNVNGRSNLDDWKNILDTMESILSKYTDSLFTFLNPIPVSVGQELKGEMDKRQVAQGINLDDGADFKLVQAKLDSESFNSLYKTLNQTLLDVSATPSVAMGKAEINNVSETTVKLMFSLAEVRGFENETMMRRSLYERLERVRTLLQYQSFSMSDEEFYSLEFVFNYNIPMNDKEIIENLKTLREMSGLSTESMLEMNPYVEDMQMEKERLIQEGIIDSSKVD
ncbi:phage portal protein [Mammaliicoccus sciuri]